MGFERRLEVVANPFVVLTHLQNSTLQKEHIETLQRVYPQLYTGLVNRLTQMGDKEVSYQKRLKLSQLLGIPLGPGTTPAATNSLQKPYQEATNKAKFGAPNMPQTQTDIQRVSANSGTSL